MTTARLSSRLAYVALAVVAFIVYGSLYPFDFHGGSLQTALHHLMASRNLRNQPWSGFVGNVAFYFPLGFFSAASMERVRLAGTRVAIVALMGALLSLAMETTQFFIAGRVSTLADVYPNVVGACLGGLVALPLTSWLDRPMNRTSPDRYIAALLLLAFLAYRLFPYVPSLDLHAYWRAVKPIVLQPNIHFFSLFGYAVKWGVVAFVLSILLDHAHSRWGLVVMMAAVLCCKVVIVHNHLSASEMIALPIVVVSWLGLSRLQTNRAAGLVALLLAVLVIGSRLLPFDWQTQEHAFGWVPFASVLNGSLYVNAQALVEKVFLYTSLIWLLNIAGLRMVAAGLLVAVGLLITSFLETHLPGRSAEITDALIAIGAAIVLHWLRRDPRAVPDG